MIRLTPVRAAHPVRRLGHSAYARRGPRPSILCDRRVVLAIAPLLLLLQGGCHDADRAHPDIALSISGEMVPYSDFDQYLTSQLGQGDVDLDAVALSGLFDQYLDGQLLRRLAVERGLVEIPVDERRAMAYLLRDAHFEPSERELRAYFAAHLSDFERPESVHLRVILVNEPEIAEQALAALEKEPFAEVAARFSQGPTAHLGGDQGFLSREDLSGLFGEVIFDLEVNEISEIVKADFGYQIFQVVERQEATAMPFEDAEPLIRQELLARFMDEQLASLLTEARERYNVRVLDGNLPFDYQGAYRGTSEGA